MSREIKFRGWQRELKKWIYGDLIHTNFGPFIFEWMGSFENRVQVESDSIGQFTGLKDKRGNEIYEGDIIRYDLRAGLGEPEIKYKKREVKFYVTGYFSSYEENIEVIGNIHQHKHLLS